MDLGWQMIMSRADKVELWRSYHPEPLGHAVLLVVKDPLTINNKIEMFLGVANNFFFFTRRKNYIYSFCGIQIHL